MQNQKVQLSSAIRLVSCIEEVRAKLETLVGGRGSCVLEKSRNPRVKACRRSAQTGKDGVSVNK